MWVRRFVAALSGVACFVVVAASHAQCAIDNDCEGDQICESGVCSAPPEVVSAASRPAGSGSSPPPAQPAAIPPPRWQQPSGSSIPTFSNEADDAPKNPRYSTPMMVGGIVMLSVAPFTLIMAAGGMFGGNPALLFGGLGGTGVLVGAGIPMIVIGRRRQPVATGYVAPWVTPQAAGLGLELRL